MYGRRTKPNTNARIMSLLDMVLIVLTVFSGIFLIFGYLTKYVNPSQVWFFSFAGLIAPFLIIINILLLLYWVVRWRFYAFIPLLVLLIGFKSIGLFFQPAFGKQLAGNHSSDLTVMSYNVMGFLHANEDVRLKWMPEGIASFIRMHDPDILCMQEFQAMNHEQKEHLDSLIGLPYNCTNFTLRTHQGQGWGVAIYSRYPIIRHDRLNFANSTNSVVWADIVIRSDTVRVFSTHLQTTSVNQAERDFIDNHEYLQNFPSREDVVRGILSKLRNNYLKRASQADTLAPIVHSSPYDVILCGDFNDTPMSYSYYKIRGELKDSFVEKGKGLAPNTFKGLFNMFRIDYILHSKNLRASGYLVDECEYSDHKAVLAEFILPEN